MRENWVYVCIGIDDLLHVGFHASYFDKILIFQREKNLWK